VRDYHARTLIEIERLEWLVTACELRVCIANFWQVVCEGTNLLPCIQNIVRKQVRVDLRDSHVGGMIGSHATNDRENHA
jgi:hypothetical protein